MTEARMLELLESAGYMAHGYCLLWEPWLVTLYAGSDLLIFVSYSLIPFAILRLVRLRPDIGNRGLLTLFASFILLCGLTHLVSILTLWVPVYAFHGWLKLATGLVSAATAMVLFPLVPRLAALPSPSSMQQANEALRAEIAAHQETLDRLRAARDGLESEVAARTAELQSANEQMGVVLQETAHRSNNLVTVVQSLARQTARGSTDVDSFMTRFGDRLMAMARATSATVRGMHGHLRRIVDLQLGAYVDTYGDRIEIEGPDVPLNTGAAQQLGLALHEMATNAIKYGALATAEGRVRIAWDISGDRFDLTWTETGTVTETATETGDASGEMPSGGLGSKLVNILVPSQLGGEASSRMTPEGLSWRLTAPAENILPAPDEGGAPDGGSPLPAAT
jgi:two-component sensor histidine kinase